MHDSLVIVEKKLPISTIDQSQPLVNTAQYTKLTETCDMIDTSDASDASDANMVTVAIRFTHIGMIRSWH